MTYDFFMHALLLQLWLTALLASPCAAQLRLAVTETAQVPSLRLAVSPAALNPGGTLLPAPTLGAALLPVPLLAPSLRPQTPVAAAAAAAQPGAPAVSPIGDLMQAQSTPAQREAALSLIFDGAHAAPAALPALPGGPAEMINGNYGFYSWLAAQREFSGSPQALASALLVALPVLQKGPVIAMKSASGLVLLCAQDASAPPIQIPFSGSVSPAAQSLASRIEAAKNQDRMEDGIHMRLAELMARLPTLTVATPAHPQDRQPEEPLPDPIRQPRPYMDRLLRDAMREEDPFNALQRLSRARQEAHRRLNYGDAARYLEQLRGAAELLARQFIPSLLEQAQTAAGEHDRSRAERLLDAALSYCEYAPAWKEKVSAAGRAAEDTLKLFDQLGPLDESTGLPVPPAPADPDHS